MFKFLFGETEKDIKTDKSIFLFVGRNQNPKELLSLYQSNSYIKSNYRLYTIYPQKEWYPRPFGITNQRKSVVKIDKTTNEIKAIIKEMIATDNLNPNQIILSGFSAGAALALQLFISNKYKAAISHNGTILDVKTIPSAKNLNPILMIHNRNDNVFTWEERYLPTKNTLLKQEYNLSVVEKNEGGHNMCKEDIDYVSVFLNQI